MWKRILKILPAWVLAPIERINHLIPGGAQHEIGSNTQNDRDVYNLMDRFPSHLKFTAEEVMRGEAGLSSMGITAETPFVCLIVRDSAYLDTHLPGNWKYHNYRDCDVNNYLLAAEELADRGFFVIRMGAKVQKALESSHPRVIDYATNGMRSDFMDIYLGGKCTFCISNGTGWDAIPYIFRRPIAFVNLVPIGHLATFSKKYICISKHYFSIIENRELSLSEIFTNGLGLSAYSFDYENRKVQLIENSPEEIRDLVVEMVERIHHRWREAEGDAALQSLFWEIFLSNSMTENERPLHGEIRANYGAVFLRNNLRWLM